ncbi:MAG: TetR/AcrR family transcriptional regulator [Chloroflexota bacterium]
MRNKNSTPSADRKAAILKEAVKLFAEQGYHNTTLDEVAKGLGITKAALYYYFSGKGQIIRAIMKTSMDQMSRTVKLGSAKMTPREKLREFIRFHVTVTAENADASRILFEQLHALPRQARQAIRRREKETDSTLQKILSEGNADGTFNVSDVKVASYALLGLCVWTYHWYRGEGRLSPEQIADVLAGLVEQGVLRHPA